MVEGMTFQNKIQKLYGNDCRNQVEFQTRQYSLSVKQTMLQSNANSTAGMIAHSKPESIAQHNTSNITTTMSATAQPALPTT